jgi:hypothetical protein
MSLWTWTSTPGTRALRRAMSGSPEILFRRTVTRRGGREYSARRQLTLFWCPFHFRAVLLTALAALAVVFSVGFGSRSGSVVQSEAVRPGGINVEPSMRPWRYVGANPDGWWCRPGACNRVANGTVFVDRELPLIAALRVSTLRIEFPWPLLEPRRGVYDWRRSDYIVTKAARLGVQLQPVLVYTPSWAGPSASAPPRGRDFAAFAKALATRYHARIHYYEIWNEPDLSRYWNGSERQYVQNVLLPGFAAIKASDPRAKVILGAPSYANAAWLDGIYDLGGGRAFDVIAYHDYSGDNRVLSHAWIVKGVLRAHGQDQKPIWLGEYGLEEPGVADVRQQALVVAVLEGSAPIAMAQWYTLRDDDVLSCCPPAVIESSSYGIIMGDYTRKQAYMTMQQELALRH